MKLSRNKEQKPTIIDLTENTEEGHTTTEHIKKKQPVVKLEFPLGYMVKLKASSILKKGKHYDEIEDFYAAVTNPNKELPVHFPLPENKICLHIGVAGFKEWVDKTRQNVMTKIVNNNELTMIASGGRILEGVPMVLTEKMAKRFV